MADNPNDNTSPKNTQREAQEAMQKEIASLKREINKINRTLAERAEEAGGWYSGATERASRAARQLGTQAHTVSETVQQNPGTISSAFVLGGIFGLLIGMMLGQSDLHDRRWI